MDRVAELAELPEIARISTAPPSDAIYEPFTTWMDEFLEGGLDHMSDFMKQSTSEFKMPKTPAPKPQKAGRRPMAASPPPPMDVFDIPEEEPAPATPPTTCRATTRQTRSRATRSTTAKPTPKLTVVPRPSVVDIKPAVDVTQEDLDVTPDAQATLDAHETPVIVTTETLTVTTALRVTRQTIKRDNRSSILPPSPLTVDIARVIAAESSGKRSREPVPGGSPSAKRRSTRAPRQSAANKLRASTSSRASSRLSTASKRISRQASPRLTKAAAEATMAMFADDDDAERTPLAGPSTSKMRVVVDMDMPGPSAMPVLSDDEDVIPASPSVPMPRTPVGRPPAAARRNATTGARIDNTRKDYGQIINRASPRVLNHVGHGMRTTNVTPLAQQRPTRTRGLAATTGKTTTGSKIYNKVNITPVNTIRKFLKAKSPVVVKHLTSAEKQQAKELAELRHDAAAMNRDENNKRRADKAREERELKAKLVAERRELLAKQGTTIKPPVPASPFRVGARSPSATRRPQPATSPTRKAMHPKPPPVPKPKNVNARAEQLNNNREEREKQRTTRQQVAAVEKEREKEREAELQRVINEKVKAKQAAAEAASKEAKRVAEREKARVAQEKAAEKARLAAAKEQARVEAEEAAKAEKARLEAERAAEKQRRAEEKAKAAEDARREEERIAKEEEERIAKEEEEARLAEEKRQAEIARIAKEKREKEAEQRRLMEETAEFERQEARVLAEQNASGPSRQREPSASYDMTPMRIPEPSTATNYNIDDLDSGDETDDDERPKKTIPGWAQKSALMASLATQFYRPQEDFDEVFGVPLMPNLTKLFKGNRVRRRYVKRADTGNWTSPVYKPKE